MRAAIYTRISKDPKGDGSHRGGDGLGVKRQEEDCRALADQLGWDVVRVFVDNDVSAYSGKRRNGFEDMLAAMAGGEFDALICWHADRLYRSMKDLERMIEIADAARVPIKAVQGGELDLSTSAGRMVARILGSVARQESEHKGERHRRANRQKAEDGVWQTSKRCFGYTAKGEPLEAEARLLRKAVTDVLAGKSLRRVATEWNDAGVLTTQGRPWHGARLRRTLVNPRYAALKVHQGKVIAPGAWKPLIDKDTHEGLVAYLTDPTRKPGLSFERKYQGTNVYLCGICGATMVSAILSSDIRYYSCRLSRHICRKADTLDLYIDDIVIERLSTWKPGEPHLAFGDEPPRVDVVGLRGQRAAVQARLDELAALFAEGAIDGSQLRRGTNDLRPQAVALDAQLAEAVRTDPVAEIVKDGPEHVARNWKKAGPNKRAKVIDRLMSVTVNPSPRGTKGFHPEYIGVEFKTPAAV